ncbi:MAG: hypothetical protein Q9170_008206 [Blastenia crenularia]
MLLSLYFLLCNLSHAITITAPIVPNPNAPIHDDFLLNQTSSADLTWPLILPYHWTDPRTGIYYKYGFSARRVSLDRKPPQPSAPPYLQPNPATISSLTIPRRPTTHPPHPIPHPNRRLAALQRQHRGTGAPHREPERE